jgi:hypothetical protein
LYQAYCLRNPIKYKSNINNEVAKKLTVGSE